MAQFSLSLTNGRGTTVLTQYDSVAGQTAGLTFDEHLNLSTDGSTLTFSMLKYLYEASQKVVNTAALSIVYGSVIRCDHNGYRDDFAVTEINYNFLSENLQLSFTAQDYFQFEVSKLGIGYTITTDTTDPEYLGAQPIDEWAYKIIQDNNIRWTYTPINTANPEIINILNNATEKELLFDTEPNETGYWDEVEASKTLNQWVSFECSNSNAFAALKQLASDNELIIVVDYSNHSFCFKPQKSFIFNGYYFNPSNNLQAFSLRGNADNLITVLNITGGKDLNDQEITLVPNMPEAVKNWVQGSDWLDTKYYPGLYDQFATNFPQFVREIAYTPWFENKLIDISYYQNNNLLMPIEVSEIQDILYNQLRIVNARMIAAQSTYLTKYEEDYMAINQRRIEAETLCAGLAADVESLRQSDLTKPPIFIAQGNDGTNVKNWVYIAPGTSLYATTTNYNDIVDYESIATDGSMFYGPLYDYLGTNETISVNVSSSASSTTYIFKTNGLFNDGSFPSSAVTICEISSGIYANATTWTIGQYQGGISRKWSFENPKHLNYSTTYTIGLTGLSISHTGMATLYLQPYGSTFLKFSFDGATYHIDSYDTEYIAAASATTNGLTVNFKQALGTFTASGAACELTTISSFTYTSSGYFNKITASYSAGEWKFEYLNLNPHNFITTPSGSTPAIASPQNYVATDWYRFNTATVLNQNTLPQYIYIKDNLPDNIVLQTKTKNNINSEELQITVNNLNDLTLYSLSEAQTMCIATPENEIAGLADHLNTYSTTREAMLQHLADNWGALLKEWYRPINWIYSSQNQTNYISDIYATYRKVVMPSTDVTIVPASGMHWNSDDSSSPEFTTYDVLLLDAVCGLTSIKYSNIVTTMQSIHTKITEYWTQCYNAAMSLGIYWPQDWDCIDILEEKTDTIFAFNIRLLGLLYGDGLNNDGVRWKVGSPLLNLYYTPQLPPVPVQKSLIEYNLKTDGGTSNYTYYTYIDLTSRPLISVWNLDLNFYYTENNQIKYKTITLCQGSMKMTTNHNVYETIIDLPGATYGYYPADPSTGCHVRLEIDSQYFKFYIQTGYYDPRRGSNPSTLTYDTYVTGHLQVSTYRPDYTTPASTYAHSYKFMDDNDSWRIIRSRSDQTQFDYQRLNSTVDQPYDNILANHAGINDNLNLYGADLRYKSEHYTFDYSTCKLPSQWLAAAVDFGDNADLVQPTGENNPAANPNLALITYLAQARQYNNSAYYNALYDHNQLWQKLLQRYPGVFRESVYQNTNAINSQELYESAKRELTKLSQPEYSYTLTGMDIYMYDSDYIPTRIKLGEQIRIDYQELGELNDSLNAALREPLYVTGINHTLRNDGDYQFTVITRTATDTMMQRFAKLLTLNR